MAGDLIVPAKTFLAFQPDCPQMRALRANTELEPIKQSDLVQVKTPGSGGLAWEINSSRGATYEKSMRGVIIQVGNRRTLWAKDFDGSKQKPACSSNDGVHGRPRRAEDGSLDLPESILSRGMPGGKDVLCAGCAFDEWGSGKGNAKACKQQASIYFLRENEVLPYRMSVQPGGLGPFKKWLKQLPVPYYYAVIEICLVKDASKPGKDGKGGGIEYSRMVGQYQAAIGDAEYKIIDDYRAGILALAQKIEPDDDDEEDDGEGYN